MRVVHCVTAPSGGAWRAVERIDAAVREAGAESSILFAEGGTERDTLAYHWKNKLYYKLFNKANNLLLKGQTSKAYFSPDRYGFDITKIGRIQKADIIHFHWISEGFFSRKSMGKLSSLGKPIVWTLHDENPYTGGCHYKEECNNHKNGCKSCPLFGDSEDSPASNIYVEKSRVYKKLNIYPVGVSNWIANEAQDSSLMGHFHASCIPNPIDISVFRMIDRKEARRYLNIPLDKKVILFGAEQATSDRRKGYTELLNALRLLPKEKYVCVVFGNSESIKSELDLEIITLGFIRDDFHLCFIYNAADVFVCPSRYENLANTVMEALSCGTPVTAFNIGGLKDLVIHNKNGFLADPYDTLELSLGIEYCAERDMRKEARQSVIDRYSYEIIGGKYLKLYQYLMGTYN